ncbi:MAG: Hpt domain-containing protein [Proteobacteria bacterium]|nr:Hpt domain-containing protein [Pseudomonadota bacterium]
MNKPSLNMKQISEDPSFPALFKKDSMEGQIASEYHPEIMLESVKEKSNPVIRRELQTITPIYQGIPMPDLLEVFKQFPQYTFFPVVDDNNVPLGIIREQKLKKFVYSRFGSTLLENPDLKNNLNEFIEPCTIVDVKDSNEEILKTYSKSGTTEGVIVTIKSAYLGVISLQSLIKLGHERELSLQEAYNRKLEQKNNDINNILQNMKQGIFTILEDGTIHHDYSAYLEDIFETKDIEGKYYFDLIFNHSNLAKDRLAQAKSAIENSLGEDLMIFEVNSHLFIEKYQLQFEDDRKKHIDLFWNPIVDENDVIKRIVVNIRDMTEMVKLQEMADQQQKEFNFITKVFSISFENFETFISSSKRYVQSCLGLLETHSKLNLSVIAHIFRNLHTIKGNSRLYGFDDLASLVHDVEDLVNRVRSREVKYDSNRLHTEISKIEETLINYDELIQSKLQGFLKTKHRGVFLDDQLFGALKETILNETCDSLPDSIDTIIRSKKILQAYDTISLNSVFNEIDDSLDDMAKIAKKQKPNLFVNNNKIRISRDISSILNIVVMHSIRNSLSHGIEDPEVRKRLNKREQGNIHLESQLTEEKLSITYWDDGAGLDLNKIMKKARDLGLIKINKPLGSRQVARFIFSPGLSTAEKVTEIAGRGVGMDAILKAITSVSGSIDIVLQQKSNTNNSRQPFKFIFHFPSQYALTLD